MRNVEAKRGDVDMALMGCKKGNKDLNEMGFKPINWLGVNLGQCVAVGITHACSPWIFHKVFFFFVISSFSFLYE